MTTLDCVLLNDNNLALVAKLGPEINSRACLCVLQGPRHITKCWLCIQHLIFLLMFCLETPKKGSGPTKLLDRIVPCELVGDLISSHSGMPRNPVQSHSVPGRDVVQRLLALSYQERHCFGSLKHFQSRLTITANTNILLWPVLFQFHEHRLILHIPQPERL